MYSFGDACCGLSSFRRWVGLVSNLHSSGDMYCGPSCLASELVRFFMATMLVTHAVACLVSEGQLPCFLMCTSQIVNCLV